uniref:Uncharacterized protein n=1 Tax=Cannabis sativa TaxID=3483 RepID=A0A803PJ90_CANSA
MVKTGVDGDPSEANSCPTIKTQCKEKYVDENPIIKEGESNEDDATESDDPQNDGKNKEEEYYYEPDLEVAKMAKELTKLSKN